MHIAYKHIAHSVVGYASRNALHHPARRPVGEG